MTVALIAKTAAFIRRKRAQREYLEMSDAVVGIDDELGTTYDPASRAVLIDQAAAGEYRLALKHTEAWGPSPGERRDRPEELASSSRLLRMLAASERAAADPDEGSQAVFWHLDGRASVDEVEVWVRLAATRDHAGRAELIGDIVRLAAQRVGCEAVQSLINFGFDAERALAAGRPPKARRPNDRKARVVATVAAVLTGATVAYAAHGIELFIHLHLK